MLRSRNVGFHRKLNADLFNKKICCGIDQSTLSDLIYLRKSKNLKYFVTLNKV